MCPTDPEDWKKIEERFRNRWNVPHAVGALDENTLLSRSQRSQAVNISTTRAILLPGTFGYSRCRLHVPVGQRGGQWADFQPQQTENKN